MTNNNNPSLNPADNGSLAGAITFAFQKMMQSVNGMLPAQVISYDRATNRANVQILINLLGTDGSQYPRPQLASVPVFVYGGGGFRLSFPLKAGAQGWVMANDRDISNYLNSYSSAPPNTDRVKSFSDGVFFPDAMRGLDTIDSADSESAVLSNDSGTVTVAISSDGLKITSNKINIDLGNPATVLNVNGAITATGPVTAPNIP